MTTLTSDIKYQAVLPYTWQPYYDECRETMAPELIEHTLFIDNTDTVAKNIGCMESHNRGMQAMFDNDADWLIIISPAIRFGKNGGMDFVQGLIDNPNHNVLEAAGVFGWHLIAFSLETLKRTGGWDTNFSPYGFCDIDMSIRIQKAFGFDTTKNEVKWDKILVDAADAGMAHSIKIARIEAPAQPRIDYFIAKWGRHPGEYKIKPYDTPFNDPTKPLSWWPTPPDSRALQHEYWERF